MAEPFDLRSSVARIVALDLPRPGTGRTRARWDGLWALAALDPSIGRLGEAHHDAVAILDEAGHARPDGLLGVWAAGGPDPLQLVATSGGWHLRGSKHWCSGASLASHALVTAATADNDAGSSLVLVEIAQRGIELAPPTWTSPAFQAVDTRTVTFDLAIDASTIVADDDWYLTRAGFWHGAIGVAACWAGSIAGVVERLSPSWRDDPHATAHRGAIDASTWGAAAALHAAADEIDAEPTGTAQVRQRRALRTRHLVDTAIDDISTRLGRALGPAPMAHHPDIHRQLAEVDLYRRQCHAERDLEALGRLVAGAASR